MAEEEEKKEDSVYDEEGREKLVEEVFTKYRELSNRTQAQIGEQTGISQPSINRYENGRLPACQYLDVIARALGLVPNYLVQKLERPTPEGSKPSS